MRIEPPFPATAVADRPEAKAVAEAFEALVLQELLRSTRRASLATAIIGESSEWRDLADRHLASVMAQGAPFGIARLLAPALPGKDGG